MSRSSDRDRIIWLLKEQGRCSNRYVRSALNLTDARYEEIRQELIKEELIFKVKGRGGGIQLTEEGYKKPSLPTAESSAPDEKSLYEPFIKILQSESRENEEPAITINTSALRKSGKWTNPDVTKVAIKSFPILRKHQIQIITYELKRWGKWNIESVFEAASQSRFAHEAYVVLEWAKEEEVVGLDEIMAVCGRFGVGLLTLHPYYRSYRYQVQLEAKKHTPPNEYLDEYLGYVFDRYAHAKNDYENLCAQQGI
jgi:hypothetical protein